MLPALVSLKSLIKTKSYHIDFPLFRLHYQVTVCALLAFCLILTAKILFGDTIDCKSRGQDGGDNFYDNLCYSQGTFTTYAINIADLELGNSSQPCNHIDSEQNTTTANRTEINPGYLVEILAGTKMGAFLKEQFRLFHRLIKNNNLCFNSSVEYIHSGIMIPEDGAVLHQTHYWHRYYQYIPIILFLQAVFFYLPHYIWKTWENGMISSICKNLHDNRFSPADYINSNHHLIEYLHNSFTLYKSLVYKYYFCQLLLLVNLAIQIISLNTIFNNQFITYGIDVFHYIFIDKDIYGLRGATFNTNDLNNPMDFVFPKVTGCTVQTLSAVGLVPDTSQYLCVLPLNILHDKFFLILWFWFLILAILTMIQISFDTLYILVPMLRKYLFNRRFGSYLSGESKHSSSLAELFLLDLIGSNSDKFAFSALLKKLSKEDWQGCPNENQSFV